MNPNSEHQRWSKWVFLIHPGGVKRPSFCDVKANAARFARLRFGVTTAMEVKEEYNPGTKKSEWRISVRSEGHPVHDPDFVKFMAEQWQRFGELGFGPGTRTECLQAKLEAGTRQDGTPNDQLIIMDASSLPNLREELEKMRREQS